MMMDAVFLAALICGGIAGLEGSRAAWALLASAAFTSLLEQRGVAFDPVIWLMIDVYVILAIAAFSSFARRDKIICALFLVVWPFYVIGGEPAYYVATIIPSLQFILTITPDIRQRIAARLKKTLRHRQEWTNIDPKVQAR